MEHDVTKFWEHDEHQREGEADMLESKKIWKPFVIIIIKKVWQFFSGPK